MRGEGEGSVKRTGRYRSGRGEERVVWEGREGKEG